MVTATVGSTEETYTYDALGRRVQTITTDGASESAQAAFYDAEDQVIQTSTTVSGSATVTLDQYVWGLSYVNDLVARDDSSTSGNLGITSSGLGERLYGITDANFDVTGVSANASGGAVEERFGFTPYGTRTVYTVSYSVTSDTFGWYIGFQGGIMDAITGLYHYQVRDYDPVTGRWEEKDPTGYAGSGPNLYQGFGSNPVGNVDPSGDTTFELNREIGAGPNESGVVRSNYNPISHTFVYTAHKDCNGNWVLDHTYSWGNTAGSTTWHKDQPEDINAANQAIAQNYMGWEEDADDGSDLDSYIERIFQQFLKDPTHEHWNLGLTNNCKDEASDLEFYAQDLWRVDHGKRSRAWNHAVLTAGLGG